MKINHKYRSALRQLSVMHSGEFDPPVRAFFCRLNLNQIRAWLAKLEIRLQHYGDETASDEEPYKLSSSFVRQCWRTPERLPVDAASVARWFGHYEEPVTETPLHREALLYSLLVAVLSLKEQSELTRRAQLTPGPLRPVVSHKRRRRIPSPRPVSPFIYV